ncbi:MAG: 2-isopropylmalate synthase, partial [Pseudomonadota bacterium]
GQRHGTGQIVAPNGFEYTGAWAKGKISGAGVATYSNGDVYEGNFLDNKRQGEGTMRYANGQVQSGVWEDGVLPSTASQPKEQEDPDAAPETDSPADG